MIITQRRRLGARPGPLTSMAVALGFIVGACGSPGTPAGPIGTQGSLAADGATTSLVPNATVLEVIDGDTIKVDINGVQESIRFIGIDTPEKVGGFRDAECYGDEASARMRQLLGPGDGVYLELDVEARDRFDRVLAYVYRAEDGVFLNQLMVDEGWAAAFPFEPNTLYSDAFDAAESRAKDLDIGLWGACGGPDLLLDD